MRTLIKTVFSFGSAFVLLLFVLIMWASLSSQDKQRQTRNDPRLAEEGQKAVEEFLRADAASALKQLYVTNDLGAFLRLEGTGFLYPVWNIQGYDFLDLKRTAIFSKGTVEIRIIVTKGSVTTPGLTAVGTPEVKDGMIFVSPPDVRP